MDESRRTGQARRLSKFRTRATLRAGAGQSPSQIGRFVPSYVSPTLVKPGLASGKAALEITVVITVNWPGASGKLYTYWLDDPASTFKNEGGNYAFVKQLPNGNFVPLYFGQAKSLQNRLPSHERWPDALRLGATHSMTHTTPAGEQARLDEERDLIQRWNPPLNVQHKKVV